MDVKGIRLLDRIGTAGLRHALRCSFDRPRLVALANAARLRFPGKRAQVVDDDRILDELTKQFLKDPEARAAAMKALIRENEDLIARLSAMTPAELSAELASLDEASAGRALFVLGASERETTADEIATLLGRLDAADTPGTEPPAVPPANSAVAPVAHAPIVTRLNEEIALLRERVERIDAAHAAQSHALDEARRREASLHQELVAARKEVHHLRKEGSTLEAERSRLKEENLLLAARARQQETAVSAAGHLEELSVRISQLIRESRKIGHDVETLAKTAPAAADSPRPYLDALAAAVESLRREIGELRREQEETSRRALRALADVATETHAIRSELAQLRKASVEASARRRGDQDRVGLFVDVQNMYYAARQLNARLDFGALMAAATRDRRLIRAIAYVVQNRDIDQSGFLAMLQQKNYEVRRKDLKIRHDGSSKGDWDMEMALDILRMAENLDVVVLVSGDGDFASLVTQIKTLGPRVEVYSFPGSTAKELIEASDRHVPIDEGFLIRMSPSA